VSPTRHLNTRPIINPYKRHRFSVEIIGHGVWLYFRFCLSYRDIEEMMAARAAIPLLHTSAGVWRFVLQVALHCGRLMGMDALEECLGLNIRETVVVE
jgi:hypothetical protein